MFYILPFAIGLLISLGFFIATYFLKKKKFSMSVQRIPTILMFILGTAFIIYGMKFVRGWDGAQFSILGISLYIYTLFHYLIMKRCDKEGVTKLTK